MTASGSIRRRACGGRFRIFGAKTVFILDGGFPAWKAEGRKVEAGEVKRAPAKFNAVMDTGAVAMQGDVQMALNDESAQVVDARSAGRFAGKEPEPRQGLRSGHMPGAFNVPFTEIVENGKLVEPARIKKAFEKGGVDLDKPMITTCGSGVTAVVLALGPRRARQAAAAHLRRLMVGMGRTAGSAGGEGIAQAHALLRTRQSATSPL